MIGVSYRYQFLKHGYQSSLMAFLSNRYMQLVKETDGDSYQKSKFQHHRAERFMFVLVTKNKFPSEFLIDSTYAIRIVLPGDV